MVDAKRNTEALGDYEPLDEVVDLVASATQIARMLGDPLLVQLLEMALLHIAETCARPRD